MYASNWDSEIHDLMNKSCVSFREYFYAMRNVRRTLFVYHDKRCESCCKQACPRHFVMKSGKGKRAERSGNETSRIVDAVQDVRREWRREERGKERNGETGEEDERWTEGDKGREREAEVNSARIFLSRKQYARDYERCRCIFVFRFKQLGHGNLALAVKCP